MFEEIKSKMEWLKNSGITSYRIQKDTGISETAARKFLIGKSEVENLRLGNVELLVDLADKLKEEIEMQKGFEEMFDAAEVNLKRYADCKDQYGSVRNLALTQQPFVAGINGEAPVYRAIAVNVDGKEFELVWDVRDNWREIAESGDESDMCDWDNPTSVEPM